MSLVFRTTGLFCVCPPWTLLARGPVRSTSCGKASQGGAISSRSNAPRAYATRARIAHYRSPIVYCPDHTGMRYVVRTTQFSALNAYKQEVIKVKQRISLNVNGVEREDEVEPRMLLVHYLRETLGLTGTHIGCDTSQCGACTVHLNGQAVKSCTMLAVQAEGS